MQKEIYGDANTAHYMAFCYYLGEVEFPYSLWPTNEKESAAIRYNKKELKERLPVFAHAGLLTEEKVEGDKEVYLYTLTEEGNKYKRSYEGGQDNEGYFCFGRINIQEVTSVEKVKAHDNIRGNYKEVRIKFTYIVDGLPEWASSEEIGKVYNRRPWIKTEEPYRGRRTLIEKNGELFNPGTTSGKIGYFLPPTE
ncbi:hypothetical protein SOASR031_30470 [Leminorella grimontii]|nr:hypothetical protein SOASR031_30470 [Leminorella grimontii]